MARKNKTSELQKQKTGHLKKELLAFLFECHGVISATCKKAGISRETFYTYLESDKDFEEKARKIREKNLDYVEDKLFQNIKKGDVASIIFYLKCQGKNRGWTEKQQVEFNDSNNELHITVTRAEKNK